MTSDFKEPRLFSIHAGSRPEPLFLWAENCNSIIVEINVGAIATVILNTDSNNLCVSELYIKTIIHQDASLFLYIITTKAERDKQTIEILLQGNRAQATVRGIVALHKKESATIITRQKHYAPHSKSDVMIKGLLAGESHFECEGLIMVDTMAKGTYACQQNKNMLMGSKARARSIPALEVKTNEVKCIHGSATGPFDKNQLLYTMSRGLSYQQARNLLISGFIADIMQKLPNSIQKTLLDSIIQKVYGAE